MAKYRLSLDVDEDTVSLADVLRNEFHDAVGADVGVELNQESRTMLAWYRVAEVARSRHGR